MMYPSLHWEGGGVRSDVSISPLGGGIGVRSDVSVSMGGGG